MSHDRSTRKRKIPEKCTDPEEHLYSMLDWEKFGKVEVRPSRVKKDEDTGRGIFACVDFERADVITEYVGRYIREDKYDNDNDQRHDAAIHWIDKNTKRQHWIIRGNSGPKNPSTAVGQLANDARCNKKNNALRMTVARKHVPDRFQRRGRHSHALYMVAKKKISAGAEITTNYGTSYWRIVDVAMACDSKKKNY